jgi:serine/threonine-protein kinase
VDPGDSLPSEPNAGDLVGQIVAGRYRVEAFLAEGGMGAVYRAVQIALDRPVALKCIHQYMMGAPGAAQRFLEEARLASSLSHPNIVQIYDFGQTPQAEGSRLFLAMELLEGVNLGAEIERLGALPAPRTAQIIEQVLAALEEAHAKGIVHRDVKPENVLLVPTRAGGERVKLIDFGIARARGADRLTQAGMLVGSPHYMAPELLRGETPGPQSDLYAVGAVLFQMLTGIVAFEDETIAAIFARQLAAERPDPRVAAPGRGVPDDIAEVCRRSLALAASDRFGSADEFAAAIRDCRAPSARVTTARQPSVPASVDPAPPPPDLAPKARTVAPTSARYRMADAESDSDALRRVEQRVDAALAAGERDRARELLVDAMARARKLDERGEGKLAAEALGATGIRLGQLLREDGRIDESRGLLTEVLGRQELPELHRALLLEQLVRTLIASGMTEAAERARIDALLLGGWLGDDAMLDRLEELARSTSSSPPPDDGAPVKRSTWRSSLPAASPKRRSS